jgi:hypothetical protein
MLFKIVLKNVAENLAPVILKWPRFSSLKENWLSGGLAENSVIFLVCDSVRFQTATTHTVGNENQWGRFMQDLSAEIRRLRLATLLRKLVALSKTFSLTRLDLDDPQFMSNLVTVAELPEVLQQTGILCAQFGLLGESKSLRRIRDVADQFFTDTVLPILARNENAEGLAAIRKKYGDFPLPIVDPEANKEREDFRWTLMLGAMNRMAELAESVLHSILRESNETELNGCESAIIQALSESGPLKGKPLAAKSGYPYNSNFKSTAASLVKRKLIQCSSLGYSLSEPGQV